VRPGERAPDFALPAVNRDGAVSITDWGMREISTVPVNPTGELAEPLPLVEVAAELDKRDGHVSTEVDRRKWNRNSNPRSSAAVSAP
jgi:hypothetical protein